MELNLATNTKEKGEMITMWWKVTFWDDNFRKIEEYLKKGSALIVHGEMKNPRTYVDKEGNSRVALEVVGHNIRFNPFGGNSDSENKENKEQSAQALPQNKSQNLDNSFQLPEC